jgi:TRAP-type mannitol/chloroaromatic compound transport system permease small subunit
MDTIKKDILRIIFRKGFVRRRKLYVAFYLLPFVYFVLYYEWDWWQCAMKNASIRKMKAT